MKTKNQDVKNTMQAHSRAKVDFYKTYLERYVAILCQSQYIKHIRVYDVFCGMGIYKDGGKGSPVVAYDTIKSVYDTLANGNGTKITLTVNDKSQERISKVTDYVNSHKHSYCTVRPFNLDVNQLFEKIIPEISTTTNDTRNLVFIDPYGYKDIKKELLFNFMRNGYTEVILFLPISHMQRFTNAAIQDEESITQYEPLRRFVYSFFPDCNHPIRQDKVKVEDYIQYIVDALKCGNRYYATSYYIERDRTNYFALFFMSSNVLGFQKILETKWKLDEDHGRGFKLPGDMRDLFEKDNALEAKNENARKLKEILRKYLERPLTNEDIYQLVIRNEFLPKHANEVLSEIQKENPKFVVWDIKNGKPARKGTFLISYKPNRLLKMYISNENNQNRMDR